MKKQSKKVLGFLMITIMLVSMLANVSVQAAETKTYEFSDSDVNIKGVINVANVISDKMIKNEGSNAEIPHVKAALPVKLTFNYNSYGIFIDTIIGGKEEFTQVSDIGKESNLVYLTYDEAGNAIESTGAVDEDTAEIKAGYTIEIEKPGTYKFSSIVGMMTGVFPIVIEAVEGDKGEVVQAAADEKAEVIQAVDIKAVPSSSKVLVNGTITSFDAYSIDGNNYFKLRDLAKAASGTAKQFEVAWDSEKKAINLISGKAYTVVGGEMTAGDGKEKMAAINTSKVYRDGSEIALTAYTIDGNNYFKLRDIAKAFNIGITWDNATKTIGIDTSISYTAQ